MRYIYKKKEFFFSILILLIFKIYHLYLNPIEHGYVTSYSANTLIFYNAKSFLLKAQSFNDWNHPGTPIYYFVLIISKLIGGLEYKNFFKFVYAHNVFTFLLYFLSINYFFNYFKKYFSSIILLVSLLFFHSFYMSLHTLEFVDPTNYLIPFGLILLVQTFKILTKKIDLKIIIKFSLIMTLAMFTKLSFLPFVISSLGAFVLRIFHIVEFKLVIKRLFQLFSFSFLFTILWNFPIIGRIPKILYAAVFTRNDTLLNFDVLIQFLNNFFSFYLEKKIFFLILIIFILFISCIFYIQTWIKIILKQSKFKSNELYIFIFGFLLFLSFNYTLLNSAREYELFLKEPGIGDLLRNCFHYSLFIIPFLYFFKFNKKFLIIFNLLVICAFLNNFYFYENYRYQAKNNLENHEKIFKEKTKKYLENKRIAIFNTGYPNTSLLLHHIGNNVFAGERFINELNKSNSNIRFLRVADIYDQINLKNNLFDDQLNLKKLMNKLDIILKKNLNRELYLILSPNSFRETSNFIGFKNREKSLYISEENVDYIVFNSSNKFFLNRNVNIEKFISFLKSKQNFTQKNIFRVNILNDVWYLIKLDK